jgi:RimJ/RimL family protein N-acetyltransferase
VDARIRPYAIDDAAVVVDAVRESLAELRVWMPWAHAAYSVEDSRAWLEAQVRAFEEGTAFEFAMVAEDGAYLGGCGLNQIDQANHRANLGYWVRSTATRRGVATTGVRALRDWAFRQTTLIRLEIVVAAGNLASLRVAEKVGAAREGTLHRRLILHGRPHDAVMFSLTRQAQMAWFAPGGAEEAPDGSRPDRAPAPTEPGRWPSR